MNDSSPSARRGLILIEQGRYSDAERFLRESLASEPNDPSVLYYLAVCELNQSRPKDALATVERALALDPDADSFHSLRGLALVNLKRGGEARVSIEEALRLDPDSDFAFVALAALHISKNQWAEAETAARKALEINPENSVAANQLAHALRLQNRLQESEDRTAYMLSQNPEDADAHCAAGWTALQRGQVKKAEEHFLESLRLEAGHKAAREGLKEAFKARSPIYRAYLNYCFFMQRFTAGKQWLVVLGLIFAVRIAGTLLPTPLAMLVIVLYFLFVLWVHVARAVGNFQLTFDRFARHSLNLGEKLEAYFVGGGVVLGLPLVLLGILATVPLALILGLTLIGVAFPLAYTFTNASKAGRLVFGGAAVFVGIIGIANLVTVILGHSWGSWVEALTPVAGLVVIAVTWLCAIPALNRRA
jgi:tetratricopeptide (TPR) repeat protein